MSTRATEAESVLKEHMGYLPVSEMERRGVSRTEISRFVREAKLEKAAKGLYVSPNAESDPLFELQYRYPKAIFSHETALFLLGEGASPPDTDDYLRRVLVIVATPDLPQGGSGDQKPPKRRPWRGTPLDVQRRRISDEEADVRGETRRNACACWTRRHELPPRPRTQSASRNAPARRGATAGRATGRNEKPLVDWYRSTMDKPKTLHPRYLSQEERIGHRGPSASGRFDPRHRPPAGPRPRHGQPRGRRSRNPESGGCRPYRAQRGRGPAQTPKPRKAAEGATVGRDRRRVAPTWSGADSQPAEAGLPG